MKIYIAGPISGIRHGNAPEFYQMAANILAAGHDPINPHDLCEGVSDTIPKVKWAKCMKKCISALMECDAIVMLKGWENSKGARTEKELSKLVGIPGITSEEIEEQLYC